MKNLIFSCLICLLLVSCSKNEVNSNCNFLRNAVVNYPLNLNLNSALLVTSGTVYVPDQGYGGIIIINVGFNRYRAWDAADPNHPFSTCSIMTINGINATCNCEDGNEYILFTGQPLNNPLPCRLQEYYVDPNSYFISN